MAFFVTQEELKRLPRWALVALAAHSARKMLPEFQAWQGETCRKNSLEQAVLVAEESAATASADRRIIIAARDAARESVDSVSHDVSISPLAFGALAAAMAAVRAAEAALAANFGNQYVLIVAAEAAVNAAVNGHRKVRGDLESLEAAAVAQRWDDFTAVSPEFFEPSANM